MKKEQEHSIRPSFFSSYDLRPTTYHHVRSGFTLLELILVTGILFAFVAVVAPRFSDFVPALRVKRTAEELLAAARRARTDAVLYGRTVRLRIDAAARTWALDVQKDPFRDPESFRPATGFDAEPIPLPEGVQVESAEERIEFHPDGTAMECTLTLSDDRGNRTMLRVEKATGKTSVEE